MAALEKWFKGPFTKGCEAAAEAATDDVLKDAVVDAKRGAPVDTGAHRKSIRREGFARPAGYFSYKGIRAGGYVRNPKTGRLVDYSVWLEYGTSRMRARPHLRPALRRAAKKFPDYFYQQLAKEIKLE